MNEKQFFAQLIHFSAAVHSATHEVTKDVKPAEISQLQYKMLELLFLDGPLTPSKLNDCLHLTLLNTSRELAKLTEKGLIERTIDERDRRKQSLQLSAAGRNMMMKAFALVEERLAMKLEDVTREEYEALSNAMALLQAKVFK